MSTIGENRLTVYKLLYEHPMCQYIKNQELNVLILGTDEVANEAFLASFWCGQYPDTKLHITIAAENASEYISELRDKLPGLKQFADFYNGYEMVAPAEKTPYADISVADVAISAIQSSGDLSQDAAEKLRVAKQNYVFVSLGDDVVNHFVAESLKKEICTNNGTALIHVFDSSEKIESCDEVKMNYPSIISVDEFADTDLYRIARNINLVYSLEETGWCSIKEINETGNGKNITSFYDYFLNEFKKGTAFLGKNYNADSSIASAVHTAYKTAYCGGESQYVQAAVQQEGDEYRELVILEHRRWVAYMAVRGYRMPEGKELDDLLGSPDHRDNKKLFHPCMCDCGNMGVKDNLFSRKILEKEPKEKPNDISELDWISLQRYWKLSEKIGKSWDGDGVEKDIEELQNQREQFSDRSLSSKTIENLIQAIEKLKKGEDKANELFKIALDDAEKGFPENKTIQEIIKHYSDETTNNNPQKRFVDLAKKRNERVNFFGIDAKLIQMLPFCLSFGKKNRTMITVSAGNPLEDVKAPLLMLADKAVFYSRLDDKNFASYKTKVETFFRNRGNNTKAYVEQILGNAPLQDYLKRKIAKLCDSEIVFNIVNGLPATDIFAIAQFSIPAVAEDHAGIKAFGADKTIEPSAQHFKMSVDEFLMLQGWERTAISSLPMNYDDCDVLEERFWTTISTRIIADKSYRYTKWEKMHELCYRLKREDDKKQILKDEGKSITVKWREEYIKKDYSLTYNPIPTNVKVEMPCLIQKLAERRIIKIQSIDDNNEAKYQIVRKNAYIALSEKSGTFFELLVYYKLKHTGLLNELQAGVIIDNDKYDVKNEYDIIAMNNLTPILFSCKSTADLKKEYIYEIASEASVLHGIAVLVVAQDLSTWDEQKIVIEHHDRQDRKQDKEALKKLFEDRARFVERAKAWGVSVLDASILKNEEVLKEKIQEIIKGECVYPLSLKK